MALLDEIKAGRTPLVVGLYCYGKEKEWVACYTIEEAKELVHKPMAPGWAWRLDYNQFAWGPNSTSLDKYRPEVAEVERALELTPISELMQ